MEYTIVKVVIVLFMLSLITEKVSNFIKLNFSSLRTKKAIESDEEKTREKKINALAVITGIIIAVSCNANFFELVSNGELKPWSKFSDISFLSIFGAVITGVFLSQGSKFFHDLLDTVLYYKNVKRSLYNKQEIINEHLESNQKLNADFLIKEITAEDREDENTNNL